MKKALFIDRDGTIIREPADEQIDSFEKLEFVPGAISALRQIARKTNYELILVSNQDGLGTTSFPEDTFWPIHNSNLKGRGNRIQCTAYRPLFSRRQQTDTQAGYRHADCLYAR